MHRVADWLHRFWQLGSILAARVHRVCPVVEGFKRGGCPLTKALLTMAPFTMDLLLTMALLTTASPSSYSSWHTTHSASSPCRASLVPRKARLVRVRVRGRV